MMENVSVVDVADTPLNEPIKHKRGRPKKGEIRAAMKPNNGKVGRPAGDNQRMLEFKARIMSTKGMSVIEKVLSTALEDGHPAQAACLKMVMDRALPVSMFDEKNGSSKPTIQINISGINDSVSIASSDAMDDIEEGEYSEDV
jgi:hypothetical protein